MTFSGFSQRDFDVFSVPDFAGRMGEIRARIRPRLLELAEDLTPRVEELVGMPTFPHVAQHMRRRVNPPGETWVAFARDRKGYKRWTHYRVAISGNGVRVTVFIEDDADDKPGFGAVLRQSGRRLLDELPAPERVRWYTLEEESGSAPVTPETLHTAGERLQRLKGEKFQAGIPVPREDAARMKPAQFEEWALEQMKLLRPLYMAGSRWSVVSGQWSVVSNQ